MIVRKNCEVCGVQFEYDEKPGFPRKYCPACSAKKKAEWENKQGQPIAQPEKVVQNAS